MYTLESLLKQTWTTFRNNFQLFFWLAIIIYYIPITVWGLYVDLSTAYLAFDPSSHTTRQPLEFVNLIFSGAVAELIYWIAGILLMMTIYHLMQKGKFTNVKSVFYQAKPYILPGFILMFVFTIFIVPLYFMLIIPGIIFTIFWTFAPNILIDEKCGTLDCLRKSFNLIKGKWWQVFGYFIVVFIPYLIIHSLIPFFAGVIGGIAQLAGIFWLYLTVTLLGTILNGVISAVMYVLVLIFSVHYYQAIKKAKA